MNAEIFAILAPHFPGGLYDLFTMRPIIVDQVNPTSRHSSGIHESRNRANITPKVLIRGHDRRSGFHRAGALHPFRHFMKKRRGNNHDWPNICHAIRTTPYSGWRPQVLPDRALHEESHRLCARTINNDAIDITDRATRTPFAS